MSKIDSSNPLQHGENPQVGVGAVILDGAQNILLQLRRKPPEAEHWSIAGGRVEFMEPIETAIVREVKEELGIDVTIEALLCVTDHIVAADNAHWVSPAFLVRIVAGEITNCEPESTQQVKFFPLGALPQKLTLTARTAIDAYIKRYLTEGVSTVGAVCKAK